MSKPMLVSRKKADQSYLQWVYVGGGKGGRENHGSSEAGTPDVAKTRGSLWKKQIFRTLNESLS